MKILVITSCTSKKKYKPSNQLIYEDFASTERLQQRTEELRNCSLPTVEMYTGLQHLYLMEGIKLIRDKYGTDIVDLNILSAGYGLLKEKQTIVPYNITFQGLKKNDIIERSDNLQIHKDTAESAGKYDLIFFLLGKEYVQALQLPFLNIVETTLIFLLGKTHKKLIPELPNLHFVPAGKDLASSLGVTVMSLKGFVFNKLCEAACEQGFQVFEQVKENPVVLLDIIK
ncbi:hypothetical protein JT359_11750 [Candidatus Poribacteria bacterium]|nr:hypothetical protein [Candidatus Poribacteria bacterium]